MKIDLSRRCECGRKPGHGDRKFYEGEDRFGIYCGSCGRLIVEWANLAEPEMERFRAMGRKLTFSDYNDWLFGRG